jgi:hypothetical protein
VKRKLLPILALAGLLLALAVGRASAATQTTSDVVSIADPTAAPPPGSSTLTRTSNAIAMDLHTTGLTPGDAVTIWWMVFNHPEACTSGSSTPDDPTDPRCGMADMGNPAADLSVLFAAGHVIDDAGVAEFGGKLAVNDASGAIMGTGLHDPAGADVTLVVHDHGPAKPGQVDEQIHTFGACNPGCTDLQMSVHQAG